MSKQNTILIKNAEYIVTVNSKKQIYKNKSILVTGNRITSLNTHVKTADYVIDAREKMVTPGFINCHHHMFQAGLRGMPQLQNQKIDRWIAIVCRAAQKMNEEIIYQSARINMAELLLYGCTTTTDMLYLFPKGKKDFFEATIQAAQDIGIRFHPFRGSMSLSKKDGAAFPDDVVETSNKIIKDTEMIIKKFHDQDPYSMVKIGIAPCTLFTSSDMDYLEAAKISKRYSVNLQTHLSESEFENDYCFKKYGKRPLKYLQDLGWKGKRVSFTHAINLRDDEIYSLSKTKTNIVHCPISNARSPIGEAGIAPIWEMLNKNVTVGIGVDGSAGNDSSNVLEELRWARTLQGARSQSTYLQPYDVLKMGTINGAKLLNWDASIGSLEEGKAADLAVFDLNHIESAGAIWDPITALFSTQARRADTVIVNGKIIVSKGKMRKFNEQEMVKKSNNAYKKLMN